MADWFYPEDLSRYAPLLLQGLVTTVILAGVVMGTAFIGGIGIAIFRYYRVPILSPVLAAGVYGIRCMPVVMWIVLVHFGILPYLGIDNSFLLSAYVALSLSTAAYISEILRGGFYALHPEEREAGVSLGLNVVQQLIYVLIPLVVNRMMPALVNQFVTLIKDTSLTSIIGVIELTRAAEVAYEQTLHEMTLLLFVALLYFLLCYRLSSWARELASHQENRLDPAAAM